MNANIYFDPDGDGIEVFLGPTESRLMELVWTHGKLSVKQAIIILDSGSDAPAYSTIATILSRLAGRGLLKTEKRGRNFVYSPLQSKEEFLTSQVARVRTCLKRNFAR